MNINLTHLCNYANTITQSIFIYYDMENASSSICVLYLFIMFIRVFFLFFVCKESIKGAVDGQTHRNGQILIFRF